MAAGLPRGRGLSRRLTGAEGRRAAGLTARTAVLLLNSGQSTHAAVATVERLNELLGTRLTLLPTWSQVTLTDADGTVAAVQAIRPVTVHMGRATLIQRRLSATGSLSLDELEDLLEEARTQPSSPTWMFALAAGLGASLLALIFGAHHPPSVALAFAAAGAGGLAHAAHWVALTWWHWNAPASSLLACLVAGGLLTPVCHSRHIPFAGAGFAAVVALVPGVYLFRAAAGTLSLVGKAHAEAALEATASDLATAVVIVLAMAVGLVVPHRAWARLAR